MMFGAKVRFGVTFKANQPDFTIYTRKYGHNFKVPVDLTDHEGAIGATLKSLSRYVIAHGINLTIYDQHTFKNNREKRTPITVAILAQDIRQSKRSPLCALFCFCA